jgi:dTDP-glucose pyrophosphorylase
VNARLKGICVGTAATIRQTMESISDGAVEIALLVDDRGRLLGTLSDGDLRRALLGGASLDGPVAPHAQGRFTAVSPDADRAGVLDLMHARSISQVPILDHGVVVGLHVLRELLGAEERDNVAVIMAGGRGTRLRPLTEQRPKPMLAVAGRPILERIVLHLTGAGIRTIYLAVNYLADLIEEYFGDGDAFGCRIEYLREDVGCPLGTAGALALLPPAVSQGREPLLVMNGDLVTQFHVGRLLEAHTRGVGVATVGVRDYVHEVPFGVVSLEGDAVATLDEKPVAVWTVNAGVYVVEPSLLRHIETGREFPMTELIASALRRGERVFAHRLEGDWLDVGRVSELRQARGEEP